MATGELRLPNKVQHARDNMADRIQKCIDRVSLVYATCLIPDDAKIALLETQIDLTEALRWANEMGSQTRPTPTI